MNTEVKIRLAGGLEKINDLRRIRLAAAVALNIAKVETVEIFLIRPDL